MQMRVRDSMKTNVFTVRIDKKLLIAKEIMTWAHVRHVPVVDADGQLVGMISHRDLLGASIASIKTRIAHMEREQHLWSVPVREVMRHDVKTIQPDAPIQEEAQLMRVSKVGCLPVVEHRRLIGVITESDLLGIVERLPDLNPSGA